MIRQDHESTLECKSGRIFVLPYELMCKLMGIEEGDDKEIEVLKTVMDGGGDMLNLNQGGIYELLNVEIHKKHMVDNDGVNIPVLEMKSGRGNRFLMNGELTCEEYMLQRCKEINVKGAESLNHFNTFVEEYKELMKS